MERLMKPSEVAPLFNVKAATVKDWARRNKIPFVRTPGGEIRVRPSDVARLLGTPQPINDEGPAGAVNTARAQ
jgi:excisionase family DNA binding protein